MVLINVTSLNVKMSAYDAVDGSSTGIQVLLFRSGECLLVAQSGLFWLLPACPLSGVKRTEIRHRVFGCF
jgi:hypothetical protein